FSRPDNSLRQSKQPERLIMKKLFTTIGIIALPACIAWAQPISMGAATSTPASGQASTNTTAVSVAAIPAPPRANSAIIPDLSRGFMTAHNNFVEVAKKGDIDVLFMGDSITDWWRSAGRGGGTNGVIPYGGKAVFE